MLFSRCYLDSPPSEGGADILSLSLSRFLWWPQPVEFRASGSDLWDQNREVSGVCTASTQTPCLWTGCGAPASGQHQPARPVPEFGSGEPSDGCSPATEDCPCMRDSSDWSELGETSPLLIKSIHFGFTLCSSRWIKQPWMPNLEPVPTWRQSS